MNPISWYRRTRQQKKARASKPPTKSVFLRAEELERRDLMSLNAWLPQRLDPVNGLGQPNPAFQTFLPVSVNLEPQLGLASTSIALAAALIAGGGLIAAKDMFRRR